MHKSWYVVKKLISYHFVRSVSRYFSGLTPSIVKIDPIKIECIAIGNSHEASSTSDQNIFWNIIVVIWTCVYEGKVLFWDCDEEITQREKKVGHLLGMWTQTLSKAKYFNGTYNKFLGRTSLTVELSMPPSITW